MPQVFIRLSNVLLRILSMASRFCLVFGLAYFIEPKEMGEYGLVVASLGFSVLIIGGDYYTYSHRELMSSGSARWGFIFQHHAIALIILYFFLLPVQFFYFSFGLLPWSLSGWFFMLLISEHLAQEMNRVLIAIQEPLMASIVLFLRAGVWVWLLLPWMWVNPDSRSLNEVFFFWVTGSSSSVLIAFFIVRKKTDGWQWGGVDWPWIIKGFGVGMLFLFSALSFKALTTVDRYFVVHFLNTEMLAVYVLYTGMAMSIYSVIDAAVTAFLYPRIVSAWRNSYLSTFNKLMSELWWATILLSISLALMIGVSANWVLSFIGKELYVEYIELLWVLLLAAIVYSVGLVPHYGLYAKGGDAKIMVIHLSSLIVFFITMGLTTIVWLEGAVAVGLLITFCWIGGAKFLFYRGIKSLKRL